MLRKKTYAQRTRSQKRKKENAIQVANETKKELYNIQVIYNNNLYGIRYGLFCCCFFFIYAMTQINTTLFYVFYGNGGEFIENTINIRVFFYAYYK